MRMLMLFTIVFLFLIPNCYSVYDKALKEGVVLS